MPSYRVHHLKDHLRQTFRFAAHTAGTANVKPRDYTPGGAIEAKSVYAAYFELRGSETPIQPGDLLETETGELSIFKFIGFEPAQWVLPEPRSENSGEPVSIPAAVE